MNRISAIALVAGLTAPPMAAADQLGTVEADLGGEARIWQTLSMERGGETVASAELSKQSLFTMLHIQAHPEDRYTTKDVMNIDVMWMGGFDSGKAPTSVDLFYMPEGMSGPFWTSEDAPEPATVSFDITAGDDTGRVSGTFSGMLCFKKAVAMPPDPGNCKPVSGTVDSGLHVVEK